MTSQIQDLIETQRLERTEVKAGIDAVIGQVEDLIADLTSLTADQVEDSLLAIAEGLKAIYEPLAED